MECPKCGGRMRKAWFEKPLGVDAQTFRATGYHWECGKCGIVRTQGQMNK